MQVPDCLFGVANFVMQIVRTLNFGPKYVSGTCSLILGAPSDLAAIPTNRATVNPRRSLAGRPSWNSTAHARSNGDGYITLVHLAQSRSYLYAWRC